MSLADEQRSVDRLGVPIRADELQEPRVRALLHQLPESDEVRSLADRGRDRFGLAVVLRVDGWRELLVDVGDDFGMRERRDEDHESHVHGVAADGGLVVEDDDVHHLSLAGGALFDLERALFGALRPDDHLEQADATRNLHIVGHPFDDASRVVHGAFECFVHGYLQLVARIIHDRM